MSGIEIDELRASWVNEGYSPQEYFFNTIVRKAHEGPVKACDFEEFVNCHNWLLMDRSDMAFSWQERNPDVNQVITKFWVRRVFTDRGQVEIVANIGEYLRNGTLMHLDADELALRMDAS